MASPFSLNEEDAMKLLVCEAHIGGTNVDFQNEQYVWKRRNDGTHIINVKKTWDKLYLAARAIAAIENPADVCVISARPYAQRALLKFAAHTGATPIFGRFTPGCFTNQIQKNFKEPRLLVISDPRMDHQAVTEASYVNLPVIAFCNTDSPLKYIDIAIPCNNKGQYSIGLMWWLLAREVLTLRGKISRQVGFLIEDKLIMPDLYFYRDPASLEEKEEEQTETRGEEKVVDAWGGGGLDDGKDEFALSGTGAGPVKLDFQVPNVEDWAAASTWDQPAITAATTTTQQAPAAPTADPANDWTANAGSTW